MQVRRGKLILDRSTLRHLLSIPDHLRISALEANSEPGHVSVVLEGDDEKSNLPWTEEDAEAWILRLEDKDWRTEG